MKAGMVLKITFIILNICNFTIVNTGKHKQQHALQRKAASLVLTF